MNSAKREHIHRAVFFVLRLVLGGIFIVAGIPKIMDTASFAGMVYNYQLLPDWLINLTALFLPWLEVLVGALILTGLWLPGAVILYNGLMISFIVALSFNMARGLDVSCGCFFNDPGDIIDFKTIARDGLILIGSLYLAYGIFFKKTPRGIFPKQNGQEKIIPPHSDSLEAAVSTADASMPIVRDAGGSPAHKPRCSSGRRR